jgi:hypothetical protein
VDVTVDPLIETLPCVLALELELPDDWPQAINPKFSITNNGAIIEICLRRFINSSKFVFIISYKNNYCKQHAPKI